VLRTRVAHSQLPATAAATDEAGKQCIAVLWRTMVTARGNVVAHHAAYRLRTLPVYVALMVAGLQRQPLGARLAAAFYPRTRAIIAGRDAGLTIGIGAAVEGIGDDPVDGGIAGPAPD
jgi:hypothetical protein